MLFVSFRKCLSIISDPFQACAPGASSVDRRALLSPYVKVQSSAVLNVDAYEQSHLQIDNLEPQLQSCDSQTGHGSLEL